MRLVNSGDRRKSCTATEIPPGRRLITTSVNIMGTKESKSAREAPIRGPAKRGRRSANDRSASSLATDEERTMRQAEQMGRFDDMPLSELCRECQDVCLKTARHCMRQVELGHPRYLLLLHAAVECHDALGTASADLLGPEGQLRKMATKCCDSACVACVAACARFLPRDRFVRRCRTICRLTSERLKGGRNEAS